MGFGSALIKSAFDKLMTLKKLKKSYFLLEDSISGIVASGEEIDAMDDYLAQILRLLRHMRRGDNQRALELYNQMLAVNLVVDLERSSNYFVFVSMFDQLRLYLMQHDIIDESQNSIYSAILSAFTTQRTAYVANAVMLEGFSFVEGEGHSREELTQSFNYLISILRTFTANRNLESRFVTALENFWRLLIDILSGRSSASWTLSGRLSAFTTILRDIVREGSSMSQVFIGSLQVVFSMVESYVIANFSDRDDFTTVYQGAIGNFLTGMRRIVPDFSIEQITLEQFYSAGLNEGSGVSTSDTSEEGASSSAEPDESTHDVVDDAENPDGECDDC